MLTNELITMAIREVKQDAWTDELLAPYCTLDSYASYIAWRTAWKAAYRQLTLHQRWTRGRHPEPTIMYQWEFTLSDGTVQKHGDLQPLSQGHRLAWFLLALRAYGKRESARRRRESQASVTK